MRTRKPHINPEILRWAREESGLSIEDAAQKASVAEKKTLSAPDRLCQWETGADKPTYNQLKKLAQIYYLPILTFYLKKPPVTSEPLPDFRTVGDHPPKQNDPLLSAFIRKITVQQQGIITLLTDDGPPEKRRFIGRFRIDDNPTEIAKDLRRELGLTFADQRRLKDKESLFKKLRHCAEEQGIFVTLDSDLGSHHTALEADSFRGIALADPIAPFIVINPKDARAAHNFTLVHELAHLWLGKTGISDCSAFAQDNTQELEKVCNKVATEFLAPRAAIETAWRESKDRDLTNAIEEIAKDFSISRAAVAHRLWTLNFITKEQWWSLYNSYQKQWKESKEKNKNQKGGPNYYTLKKNQLGSSIIKTVLGALDSGELTYTRASQILGVKAKGFDRLREGVQ